MIERPRPTHLMESPARVSTGYGRWRPTAVVAMTAVLAGCSTLPSDGPSRRAVDQGAATSSHAFGGYALVDLNFAVSEALRILEPGPTGTLAAADSSAPLDLIESGDVLNVAIFEPSGTLFGQRSSEGLSRAGSATLPSLTVDRNGQIVVPFAGRVTVQGLTETQASDAIRRALVGRVGSPQVVVALEQSPSRGVTVLGEVRTPGRTALTVGGNRLLDAIAQAGGTPRPVEDVEVHLQRQGQTWQAPLAVVTGAFDQNVRLARGDQINLVYKPRRYAVFGALGQVTQSDLPAGPLTLAGALSRAGGLNGQVADARAVMVFRFERPEVAHALGLTQTATPRGVPVIYRLDLTQPSGVFVANTFELRPEDVIHAPRSGASEARTFFEFVQSITRVIYDVSVTSALNLD